MLTSQFLILFPSADDHFSILVVESSVMASGYCVVGTVASLPPSTSDQDFNLPDPLPFPHVPHPPHHSFLLPCHSKVFFTDYGSTPRVERCDMDGQNRTKLVDSKIVFPHGITLDLVNRMVYWADAYLDYIEVVDYEGKNRHTILQGFLVRSPVATEQVKAHRLTK